MINRYDIISKGDISLSIYFQKMLRFISVACVAVSTLADDYNNEYPRAVPAAIYNAADGKMSTAVAQPAASDIGVWRGDNAGFGLNPGFGLKQYIYLAYNNPDVPYTFWRYAGDVPTTIATATGGKIAIAAATASGLGGFNWFGSINDDFDGFGLNRGLDWTNMSICNSISPTLLTSIGYIQEEYATIPTFSTNYGNIHEV